MATMAMATMAAATTATLAVQVPMANQVREALATRIPMRLSPLRAPPALPAPTPMVNLFQLAKLVLAWSPLSPKPCFRTGAMVALASEVFHQGQQLRTLQRPSSPSTLEAPERVSATLIPIVPRGQLQRRAAPSQLNPTARVAHQATTRVALGPTILVQELRLSSLPP